MKCKDPLDITFQIEEVAAVVKEATSTKSLLQSMLTTVGKL